MVKIIKGKCTGCGDCIEICPAGAITLQNGKAVIDQDKCMKCLACVNVCPNNAIKE